MKKLGIIFLIMATAIIIFSNKKSEDTIIKSPPYLNQEQIQVEKNQTDSIPVNQTQIPKSDIELQRKIDQLFVIGFRGFVLDDTLDIYNALSETNLGGVILFDYDTPTKKYNRNIQASEQVKKLISDLQNLATTPLFIAIDEEGGKVSRLKNLKDFQKISSAKYLGSQKTSLVYDTAKKLGQSLGAYGFNLDFAPVLDTNVNPSNPIIGAIDRSFSTDPKIVSEKGIAFMKGLIDGGIIPVGKHFPGHGSSKADSHLGFVDITKTYKDYELNPFKDACNEGLPAIMIAHVYNKNIDEKYPATLSSNHVDVLKNQANCENTLIISDDMDMKAISSQYGRKEALVKAINAGIDVIIISNNVTTYDKNAYFEARKIVFEAVKNGEIESARIEQSFEKIKSFKLNNFKP